MNISYLVLFNSLMIQLIFKVNKVVNLNLKDTVIIKFIGQESRLLDLALKDFCKLLKNKNIVFIGPNLEYTNKTNNEIYHKRNIKIDSKVFVEAVGHIHNFDFPPSIDISIKS